MVWVPSNSQTNKLATTLVRALFSYPLSPREVCACSILTFPGPSSNIAFLRHISEAFAQASGQRQVTKATLNPSNPTADWVRVTHAQGDISGNALNPSEDGINIYALPSETRTWVLINEYFQKTGQLLPIIHEASFRETFIEMKRSNFTATRRTWLGLVNIILALGCTLIVDGDDTAKERIAESDVYCQRANRLCEREPRRSISLELGEHLSTLSTPITLRCLHEENYTNDMFKCNICS